MTLIEVLVVIVIISTLASLLLPAVQKVRLKGVIVKTKAIIDSLEAALSMYETDFGDYPESDGSGSKVLYESLVGPIENENWKGPYIRLRKQDMNKEGNIVDAWKRPIIYKYPQDQYENTPYIIFSFGPDGKKETEDDIGNW